MFFVVAVFFSLLPCRIEIEIDDGWLGGVWSGGGEEEKVAYNMGKYGARTCRVYQDSCTWKNVHIQLVFRIVLIQSAHIAWI